MVSNGGSAFNIGFRFTIQKQNVVENMVKVISY